LTETLTNSTTTLIVGSTNGFVAGQVLLLQHLQAPLERFECEPAIVASVNVNGTNVVLVTAPSQAVLPGDMIYQLTVGSTFVIGNATVSFSGAGVFSGQRQTPLLLLEGGSTNLTINAACATAVY